MFCFLYIEVSSFTEDADDKGRELVEIWEWSGKKVRITSLYKKELPPYTRRPCISIQKGLNPCMSKTNLPVQVTVTFLYMYM